MTVDHPNPAMRWRHMRRMAYIALTISALQTFAMLSAVFSGVPHELLSSSSGWIGASYLLWGAIIGAYMGVSGTADAFGFKQ